jgi:hypothetical protein
MEASDLERDGEVWSVEDPFQNEEVLFRTVDEAFAFARRLADDLETHDVIRICFKTIRNGKKMRKPS